MPLLFESNNSRVLFLSTIKALKCNCSLSLIKKEDIYSFNGFSTTLTF